MVNRKKQQIVSRNVKDGQETSERVQGKRKRNLKGSSQVAEASKKTQRVTASTSKKQSEEAVKGADDEGDAKGKKRSREIEPEGIVLQSSGRISKRPKKDYDPYSPPRKPAPKKQAKTPETRKGRRNWELWTIDDKKHFFEALKEHGRNWNGLHEYLKKHNKNKNLPERNQERIRQFYYRIWHKISKYLTCPDIVDKQVLETFGLICYGEMRKRTGSYMDAAIGEKLNEMVHKGSTYMKWREKGSRKVKTFRLKTPHCTVLQKLNNLEGLKQPKLRTNPLRLPDQITVELRPRNNAAWTTVQAMAQNPRLRTKVEPGKRLSSIIDFLNKKWKSHRLKLKENMNEKEKPQQELKLHPPPKVTLNPWELSRFNHLKTSTSQSQMVLGLKTYLENLKNFGECSPTSRKVNRRATARKQSNCQDGKQSYCPDSKQSNCQDSKHSNCQDTKQSSCLDSKQSNCQDSKQSNCQDSKQSSCQSKDRCLDVDAKVTGDGSCCKEKVTVLGDNISTEVATVVSKETDSIELSIVPERPFGGLLADSEGCGSKSGVKSIISVPSPATIYDSSHGDSAASDRTFVALKSDISSSPETNSLKKDLASECLTKSLTNEIKVDTDVSGSTNEAGKKPLVSNKIQEKLDLLKDGVVRSKAEHITIADLYLMLGNPDKIILEYEWVDVITTPDFLDLGHVTNMLRRLIHLASTEFTDFSKSRLPPALQKLDESDDVQATCSCGLSNVSTPPNTKQIRTLKGRLKKDPVTPKGARREPEFMSPVGSNKSLSQRLVSIEQSSSQSSEEFASIDQLTTILSPPSTSDPNNQAENSRADGSAVLQDIFKIPTTVAPRCSQTVESPITINNIAQKMSPNALMEHINRANSHTNQPIYLPPSRRRRGVQRVRKPMMVQRKIMPKPAILAPQPNSTYVLNGSLSVIAGGPRPSGTVKVMHPADVKGLTVKSLIPGATNKIARVCAPPGVAVRFNTPVTTVSSQPNKPPDDNVTSTVTSSTAGDAGMSSSHGDGQKSVSKNGQVPVSTFDELIKGLIHDPASSTQTSMATSTLAPSIISQAALATGISMELSNQGGTLVRTGGLISESSNMSSGSSLVGSLSALLDISIPGTSSGDTTDKLIDLALANSGSQFSVTGLLEAVSGEKNTNKDPTLNSTRPVSPGNLRAVSPGQLSPSKVFKPSIGTIDEDCFNLSNFLQESPIKRSMVTSLLSTPRSHDLSLGGSSSALLGSSLINDNSRDSVRFDVDIALQSMLNENSLDYASKFADLAEEINSTVQEEKAIQSNHKP